MTTLDTTTPDEHVPTKTRALSLRTRWTLALLITGAIPLVLLGFVTLGIQRDGLEHAEQVHEFAVIDHVVTLVTEHLHEASEATHRAGMILTDARIADDDAKLQLARETFANASSLAEVAIYLPDGTFVDAIRRRDAPDLGAPPHTVPRGAIPAGSDGAWLAPEYTPRGAILRYLEPITREGEQRAWLLGTLSPGALATQLRELSRDRFENRDDGIVVLDADGKVLASGVARGPLAVGQTLAGHDIFTAVRLTPADFARDAAYSAQFDSNGERMVGTVRSIPDRRWAVIARRPAASVFASLAHSRRSLAIAAGGFLLLALAIATFLASRTVRPIQALMRLAGAYGRRQFAVRSDVKTGDEIELLGDRLMNMADDIAKSEAEIARRVGVEANFSRFVPATIAKGIADGSRNLALGGERRQVTVLFADVAAFTPFAETTEPERVVAFLNELFGVMTEVVFRHEGTVDKFIGDCVMAVFGAPDAQSDHAERAVACADDIQRFVDSSAARWKERYGIEPKIAIGIHSGEALVGNLGSEHRMEYTCVGDTVNVAARLEGLARPGQILVTQEVVDGSNGTFDFEPLGEQIIRGKKSAVPLFEMVR